ncbi:MAG: ketopantoate reductase family protein [Gracilibacteraceae bacterium]|nr:ketopantoate reductase family protein [Gracilibacteraceae bacterium]
MKPIESVAIIGAGALGVMYGWQLTKKLGRENVCFAADKQRIEGYKKQGVLCNGERCDFRWVDRDHPDQTYDFVLFAVKFTAMEAAVETARGVCREDTIFLSVLNGIESERVIGDALGTEHLLYCVVHGMDATRTGSHVRFQNTGTIVFGDKNNRLTEDVKAVTELLERAKMSYQIPDDIRQKMWSKLMLNTGVNQVAAVFGTGYGGIQKEGAARQMMIDSMKEAKAVAACEGVVLTDEDVDQWLAVLDALDPEGLPSLYQDILAHRPTEVELFSGTVRKLGRKYGVLTPINDYLYETIKKLEAE